MTSRSDHEEWIKTHVDGDGAGLCNEYALLMAHFFPELIPVYGVYSVKGKEYGHAWCLDRNGAVVDPTKAQFEPGGTYREICCIDSLSTELNQIAKRAIEIINGAPIQNVYHAYQLGQVLVLFHKLIREGEVDLGREAEVLRRARPITKEVLEVSGRDRVSLVQGTEEQPDQRALERNGDQGVLQVLQRRDPESGMHGSGLPVLRVPQGDVPGRGAARSVVDPADAGLGPLGGGGPGQEETDPEEGTSP